MIRRGESINESRSLVPAVFDGTPRLLSVHIYDPTTRLNTFLNPNTRIAQQNTLAAPLADTRGAAVSNSPLAKREDLGTEFMENLSVHGVRVTRTVPTALNDTGHDIVVTDEYWYSDDLHMNILTRHTDPRTGFQTVAIKQVKRAEPQPAAFQVPAGYKIVDMTPPN